MAKKVTRVGRYRVEDATRSYDGEELSGKVLAGYQRRAARTILHDVDLVEPEILRYARRALELTQGELASLLGVGAETVSRWETGAKPFKRDTQLAMAGLLDEAERHDGVLPREHKTYAAQSTVTLQARSETPYPGRLAV